MMRRILVLVTLAGLLAAGVTAQTKTPAPGLSDDEAAFFGDTPAATANPGNNTGAQAAGPNIDTANPEDFFNDSASLVTEGNTSGTYKENFVKEEPIRFGGNFNFLLNGDVMWMKDLDTWDSDYFLNGGTEAPGLKLEGSLYFLARPNADLRLFGKVKTKFPFALDAKSLSSLATTGIKVPTLNIWELYSDFNIKDTVYFRAGKQMVKWGVGYFFQPADIISLTAVDITDPKADREGPLAIKANLPIGANNVDMYVIAPSDKMITSLKDLEVAGRATFVLGGWELGVGAAYQRDRDWKFISTASGSIWKIGLFGEALVNRTDPTPYLDSNGTYLASRNDWFFSGTAGASYTNNDIYLTAIGQYYFNGMGYDNVSSMVDTAFGKMMSYTPTLTGSQLQSLIFRQNTGKHYLALYITESFVKDSKVSVSALWLGNLSDGSGMIMPKVSFTITDQIILGLNAAIYYGADKTENRGISALPNMLRPRIDLGCSVSLGTGNF